MSQEIAERLGTLSLQQIFNNLSTSLGIRHKSDYMYLPYKKEGVTEYIVECCVISIEGRTKLTELQ